MEAIAFIVRRNIDVLDGLGIPVNEVICLGGGAKSPLWNQIKADVLNKTVATTSNDQDAACLGAAFVAGKAVGIYASLEEAIRRSVRIAKTYSPDERNRPVYDEAYQRYIRLYENLIPVFDLP
jgi:xylulokinase